MNSFQATFTCTFTSTSSRGTIDEQRTLQIISSRRAQWRKNMDLATAAAAQRCCSHQQTATVASAADDDTYHATNIHHSPLQPTRLFSPSNNNEQSTNNNNQNNLTAVNNNDVNNTTVNLKTLNLPRQLSTKEETNLRKLLLFQLNTSRRIQRQQRRQRCYIENEEDADNLVSYAMEWIMGGESVERVVSEVSLLLLPFLIYAVTSERLMFVLKTIFILILSFLYSLNS